MKAKKPLHLTAAILALALVALVLGGCAEDATDTMATEAEAATTVAPETTTASALQVAPYAEVTAEEAKNLIDTTPDLVIIDLGSTYDQGHIPGARSMTPDELEEAISASTLDTGVPYLLYADEDMSAASIRGWAGVLAGTGLTTHLLNPNFSAWIDAGYPLEK